MTIKKGIKRIISEIKKKETIPIIVKKECEELLRGKNILIIGGDGGIGIAIAKKACESGAKIVIAGRDVTKLRSAVDVIGNKTKYVCLDLCKVGSIYDSINEAINIFENGMIHVLINCAGIIAKNEFFDLDEDEYDQIMNVNVKGVYFACKVISKHMIDNKINGHILNVTSSSALRPAWTPYQMSKWALRGFTLGLADLLLPYGIVVNAIAPGPTATDMLGYSEGDSIYLESNPSKRYVMPDEIASLAVFLISEGGNMVVGDTFYITGGSGVISLHR